MRVVLWMYAVGRIPGGHQVQMEQTCKHLRALGVTADSFLGDSPDLAGYDLVHGFSLTPEQVRYCRSAGLPVVLSTIYAGREFISGLQTHGGMSDLGRRIRFGLVLLKAAIEGRHLEKCTAFTSRLSDMRAMFDMVDLLLPNSLGEAAAIRRELGATTPHVCVPNAVDHRRFWDANPTPLIPQYEVAAKVVERGHRDHVLYVGRFEPHKNQRGLIRAMQGTGLRLVLAGPAHPDHPGYFEECRREAERGDVTLLLAVPHEQLPDLYRAARVHVLPSWCESTGLVSLEAALCGCNIVTTNRGFASEYLGEHAWYCDPSNPRSIRHAVEAAFASPYPEPLRQRILDNYTWDHTARATLAAYEGVLANRRILQLDAPVTGSLA